MKSPAPLSEEARTPQLEALLVEEPYEVLVKETKKKKEGMRHRRATSGARSKSNHGSSIHEEEEEEVESEEAYPKRRRATSKVGQPSWSSALDEVAHSGASEDVFPYRVGKNATEKVPCLTHCR